MHILTNQSRSWGEDVDAESLIHVPSNNELAWEGMGSTFLGNML